MRIASNKLSDLLEFYKAELSAQYDLSEIYAVFELVCDRYLGFSKLQVKANLNEKINQSELILIYNAGKEIAKGIPVQYVLGQAHFYDLIFKVTPSTLIPRPETEELVDIMIKDLKSNPKDSPRILDIGTGSGCIPVVLKKNLPRAFVAALDVSPEAMEIAETNALLNKVDIQFLEFNILASNAVLPGSFNVIVSNPPYVLNSEAAQMESVVLDHEPHLALFVEDNDPIIFYKRIIDLCSIALDSKGLLYFELNPMYAQSVKNYADAGKLFTFTELLKDMSGKQRFFKAQKL